MPITHKEDIEMPIGLNIKAIREDQGLNQSELGRLANMDPTYISKVESGKTKPSSDKVKKLVIALETTADKLLFDEEEYEPSDSLKPYFVRASKLNEEQQHIVKEMLRGYLMACSHDKLKNLEYETPNI